MAAQLPEEWLRSRFLGSDHTPCPLESCAPSRRRESVVPIPKEILSPWRGPVSRGTEQGARHPLALGMDQGGLGRRWANGWRVARRQSGGPATEEARETADESAAGGERAFSYGKKREASGASRSITRAARLTAV